MEHKNDRLPIFTERFRKLQGERSNTEFADFLGISRQTVGFYYNGDRVPDALTLIKISQKCGVSTDWLMGLTNDVDRRPTATEDLGLSHEAIMKIKSFKHPEKETFDRFITDSDFENFLATLTMIVAASLVHRFDELSLNVNQELVFAVERYVRETLGISDAMIIYGDTLNELFRFKASNILNEIICGLIELGKKDAESEIEKRK